MMKQLLFCALCAIPLVFLPSCNRTSAQNRGGKESEKLGTMSITSDPSGAEISIYGKVLDKRTPYETNPVPEAVYTVKVSKDGYEPAWMPVKVVAGAQAEAHFKLVPETAMVVIDSDTTGAHVTIDGKDFGNTPVIQSEVPLGSYEVIMSQDGYKEHKFTLVVPNARPIRTNVTLEKNIGALSVVSGTVDPGDSDSRDRMLTIDVEIVKNGAIKTKESTPCFLELEPGQYTVRYSLDGFKSKEKQVIVELGKTTKETVELEELPGALVVDSEPSEASIVISGPGSFSYRGETPFRQESIRNGEYTVRLEREGYDPCTESFTVERGKTTERLFRLSPNTGAIVLNVNPPGMNVYLDGKYVTRTVREGDSNDISESVKMEKLSAGEHTIRVSNKHATPHTEEKTVMVRKGETVQVKFDDFWLPDTEIVLKTGSKYKGRMVDRYSEDSEKISFRPAKGITNEYNRSEIDSTKKLNIIDEKK